MFSKLSLMALLLSMPAYAASTPGAPSLEKGVSDSRLETIIEYRLLEKGLNDRNTIQVSVDDRVVTLEGTVANIAKERSAEELAKDTKGVHRAGNHLLVEKLDCSDYTTADEVARELRGYLYHDISDWVSAHVQDGHATLTGSVRDLLRKRGYEQRVERIDGVQSIENKIAVLPVSMLDDELCEITARLIYENPLFERYGQGRNSPIHIIVEGGRVIFQGRVATPLEQRVAASIVRNGVLVQEVVNNLTTD